MGSPVLRQVEGSRAVAHAVALCRPQVVAAYPISPQTHIVEALSDLVRTGELAPCEYMMVESEFGALSACIGASAAGARTYTATASQGLLFMAEALPNASGLGLPVVMTVANRAIGAPINIWNDHSDAMSQRDAGWIQLFAESNQEAVDLHIQAFVLAERLSLPVMVCMDGFVLTHAVEEIDVPTGAGRRRAPPAVRAATAPGPGRPVTIGAMVGPEAFTEVKYLAAVQQLRALDEIPAIAEEFRAAFGRDSGGPRAGLSHGRRGDRCRRDGLGARLGQGRGGRAAPGRRPIGALTVTCFRPWPADEVREALAGVERVIVLNRAFSVGAGTMLGQDVAATRTSPAPPSTTWWPAWAVAPSPAPASAASSRPCWPAGSTRTASTSSTSTGPSWGASWSAPATASAPDRTPRTCCATSGSPASPAPRLADRR